MEMKMKSRLGILGALGVVCLFFFSAPVRAEDWPEWRGKGRVAVWTEEGILDEFPATGLDFKWKVPIKSGFAGPSVAGGRVFALEFEKDPQSRILEGTERVVCMDEQTGKTLWTDQWPVSYQTIQATYATGPRATPTVDGQHVYVVGAMGMLRCLAAATGDLVWKKDYVKEFETDVPVWGITSSPLVDGNLLICLVGGVPDAKVVAFDKRTGKEIWRSLRSDGEMGYCPPIIYEIGGVRQLIIWHPKAVSSLNPATGEVYWEQAFDVRMGLTIASPISSGPYLFVSQFYGGSMMLELAADQPQADLMWKISGKRELPNETRGLHALISTPILEGDYIYGVCSYGELRCLNARTGERIWESQEMTDSARWSSAFFVRNGDRYFVNNDQGDLIIARFSPEGYQEVDRTKLIDPTSNSAYGRRGRSRRPQDRIVNWSHPAYANGHIVARNDEMILRASLKKK